MMYKLLVNEAKWTVNESSKLGVSINQTQYAINNNFEHHQPSVTGVKFSDVQITEL